MSTLVSEPSSTAATASSSKQRRYYQPGLDALRFFAFLSVFLHHSLNTHGRSTLMRYTLLGRLVPLVHDACGFGLSLFFFRSAYLITSLLELEKARTGNVHLRRFYVRRMLRIWPLYVGYLGGVWLLGRFWQPAGFSLWLLLAMLGMVGNWFMGMFRGGNDVVNHLWSISVEEQFYLLWPTISGFLNRRVLQLVCAGLASLALATIYKMAAAGQPTTVI